MGATRSGRVGCGTFIFRAEDSIRGADVTGVQTCALPILKKQRPAIAGDFGCFSYFPTKNLGALGDGGALLLQDEAHYERARRLRARSEERRVGKAARTRWTPR